MTKFIARKEVGTFKLYADNCLFGSLNDCEVTWIFSSDDSELEEHIVEQLKKLKKV